MNSVLVLTIAPWFRSRSPLNIQWIAEASKVEPWVPEAKMNLVLVGLYLAGKRRDFILPVRTGRLSPRSAVYTHRLLYICFGYFTSISLYFLPSNSITPLEAKRLTKFASSRCSPPKCHSLFPSEYSIAGPSVR